MSIWLAYTILPISIVSPKMHGLMLYLHPENSELGCCPQKRGENYIFELERELLGLKESKQTSATLSVSKLCLST
ncbi:hypothetical protein DL96DRAFT_1631050 [Flagelloscypha sp. PMI_526]|nr:hypothetical protein DL96DRAFT_1631050 [Flagelloscypha sp. PMI_526]